MGRDGKMDVHLGVCHDGYVGRLDVIEGPSGRRQRSDEDKARIVAESLTAGVRVAAVARRHGLTRWQVYDWRRRVRDGRLALPERIVPSPAFAALVVDEELQRPASAAGDRKSTRLNSSHECASRKPSSAWHNKYNNINIKIHRKT